MIVNKLFFQKIYSLHVFWFGSVLLPPPKMDQKYKNLLIPPFFYSSIGPVWLMLWSWNLVSWYNLSNWVCWYIVCCVAPLVFADSAKTRKINVLLKILFFENKNSFLCFAKNYHIANKVFFQNIYRLHASWSIWHWSTSIWRHYAVMIQSPLAKRNVQLIINIGLQCETLKQ